jgi:16S rRNA (cytosine967-C5)-methyltransferase
LKLHKNLCEAVVGGLDQVFLQDAHANQVVEQLLLSNKKWGARDRNFIAENIYGLIRYYRLYCYAIGLEQASSADDLWLMLGAYFLDKEEGVELPAWSEWADLDRESIKARLEEGRTIRKVRESIPDWLDEVGEDELGDKWDDVLYALNQPAPLCIRTNTLKATHESVSEFLRDEGIEYHIAPEAPDAIIIDSKRNLRNTYAYKSGWFEIQDLSSQLVAPALDIKPGMKVIDACAGAGGKTLHIAALMCGRGEIIAMDIYADKLKELESRARRNGVTDIKTVLYSAGMEHNYKGDADRVLLDVPCSATGVLRRNPDTKWKLKPEALQEVQGIQQDLLQKYSIMVKPNGIMVYATCSILPSENEMQVEDFLSRNPSFTKVSEKKVIPGESEGDGFYICQLIKSK